MNKKVKIGLLIGGSLGAGVLLGGMGVGLSYLSAHLNKNAEKTQALDAYKEAVKQNNEANAEIQALKAEKDKTDLDLATDYKEWNEKRVEELKTQAKELEEKSSKLNEKIEELTKSIKELKDKIEKEEDEINKGELEVILEKAKDDLAKALNEDNVVKLEAQEANRKARELAPFADKALELANEIKALKEANNEENKEKIAEKEKELKAIIKVRKADLQNKINDIKNSLSEGELFDKYFQALKAVAEKDFGTKEAYNITAEYIIAIKQKADKNVIYSRFPDQEQLEALVKGCEQAVKELEAIDRVNLTGDTVAWSTALKFSYELTKGNYTAGGKYLGSTTNWGENYAYPMNSFYESTELSEEDATSFLELLKTAVKKQTVLSKVVIKNNLKQVLNSLFTEKLISFANSEETSIAVADLFDGESNVEQFWKFYATEYYKASDHGLGENLEELKLYKTNDINELENTIEVNNNGVLVKLYGLGLTQKDLDAKNVGLGWMVGSEETTTGKKVYDQILKMSTTSPLTDAEINEKGYISTKEAANNTEKVAEALATLITGEDKGVWKETVRYDADGKGPGEIETLELTIRDENGKINLPNFYKYLNDESFFFGREDKSYYSPEIKKELMESQDLAEAREWLTELGYDVLKSDENKDLPYASITNEQFYLGALEAFKAYYQFKATTKDYGLSFFDKAVDDYGVNTYEFSRRGSAGVGAYSGRIAKFQFNADPYQGLPKWSVTSFANHESIMGHHNQIYYAKQYLTDFNGKKLGNIFHYTSYAEGWALFMEWFGIEAGYYGTPDYNNKNLYAMPVDFSLSKGITSFFTAKNANEVTPEIIKSIKELHGGVYWNKVNSHNKFENEAERAIAAVKYCNMVQYIGALNEAQLRNMRLAVDTAYHGRNVADRDDLPQGASISDIRKFMSTNSALGVGDIASESLRYLNLPGQATSYNSGKEVMLDLYNQVREKLGLSRKQFVETDNHKYIKELLNVYLRNGGLPMDALIAIVKNVYDLK